MSLPPVLLVGCGRMGSAMLSGWRAAGLSPSFGVDPAASALSGDGFTVVPDPAAIPASFEPAAVIFAVKPQSAAEVLPAYRRFAGRAVCLSIMAGRTVGGISRLLGDGLSIVRAMPNTPAAIGQGITVAFPTPAVTNGQRDLCHQLLQAVGEIAWIEDESLLDAVTAVSGSGPAYVFLLAELMEKAAVAQGIPPGLARMLARKTVSGSGALLNASGEEASALRVAVTSPGGTTAAALAVLMAQSAWPALMDEAIAAATNRSRELAG